MNVLNGLDQAITGPALRSFKPPVQQFGISSNIRSGIFP